MFPVLCERIAPITTFCRQQRVLAGFPDHCASIVCKTKKKALSAISTTDVPESVAFFFNGEPMAGKAEKYISEYVADNRTLGFVGEYAMMKDLLSKEQCGGAAKNLIGSFPDLTFNIEKVKPKKNEDGSWSAVIVVMGTHTGTPFSPFAAD